MTEIEALENSLEMWTWMKDQAMKGNYYFKYSWFDETNKDYAFFGCYLCNYVLENSNYVLDCSKCPVKEWRNIDTATCCRENSPYYLWKENMKFRRDKEAFGRVKNNVLKGIIGIIELLEKNLKECKNDR